MLVAIESQFYKLAATLNAFGHTAFGHIAFGHNAFGHHTFGHYRMLVAIESQF